MSSSDLDSYLLVYDSDDAASGTLIGSDDDDGVGLNAWFNFMAIAGHTYTVRLTTSGSGAHYGAYDYSITYDDRSPVAPIVDPGDKPIGDISQKMSH